MYKLIFFALFFLSSQVFAQEVNHIQARILPNVTQTSAGSEFYFGIQFDIEDQWYTYWKNPGDAGLAPNFKWTLPKGVEVGEAMFPSPKLKVTEGIRNYVYKDKVLFLFPVKVSDDYKGQFIRLKVDLEWLVCKESCIPESTSLTAQVVLKDKQIINPPVDNYFKSWQKKVPVVNDDLQLIAKVKGKTITLVGLFNETFNKVDIYPLNQELLQDVNSKTQSAKSFSQNFEMDIPMLNFYETL